MGAWVNCSINGADSASGTSWGFWIRKKRATAQTYTFSGAAIADATPASGATSVGPNPKFDSGGIKWTPLELSVNGPKGSTASAHVAGQSYANLLGYGCDMSASAISNAAASGGAASSKAYGSDPWEITFDHQGNHKSYAMITLTAEFSLAPQRGTSGCRLLGSFGEIALTLKASDNKPKASVRLSPGWQMFRDVRLPTVGVHFPAPQRVISGSELEQLLMRWHDRRTPIWMSNELLAITFLKEVQRGVSVEIVQAGIEVSDEDAWAGDPDSDQTVRVARPNF